jgi:hypothetical protein
MKVGILTYHYTSNYGATLQAYALWKKIKEQGHSVEFIDYRPKRLIMVHLRHLLTSRRYLPNRYAIANCVKLYKMLKFVHSNMALSEKTAYTRSSLSDYDWDQQYDVVVCGSDVIWSIDLPSGAGYDLSYFLDFIPDGVHKVSYAASFGPTVSLGPNQQEICGLLKRLDAIGVRDESSARLVSSLGLSAVKVLDPTFLINYDEFGVFPKVNKEYILIYGGLKSKEKDYIKTIAAREDLEVLSIGHPNSRIANNRLGLKPEEWVGCFAKAAFVFTTTFHGTIFSILFEKPFLTFNRPAIANKVGDLLSDLDLMSRLIASERVPELSSCLPKKVDFEMVYRKLSKMIATSNSFLDEVLQ